MRKISQLTSYIAVFAVLAFSSCQSDRQSTTVHAAYMEVSDTPDLDAKEKITSAEEGFALVELFTSEGCSSCPPADAVATEIATLAERTQKPIYVLSYHVDYWNYLGWKDRFSAKKYTHRQYWYADRFNTTRVYTPQMIINGQSEFTGSKKTMAFEEISSALEKTAAAKVQLTLNDDLSYAIQSNTIGDQWQLHYVLVEKDLRSKVNAGENRGRNLYHYSVVRELMTLEKPSKSGSLNLVLPEATGKYDVVAFLQHHKTAEILAADKVSLEPKH